MKRSEAHVQLKIIQKNPQVNASVELTVDVSYPASHTGQLGSRALTDSAENIKQRQATLETSISFYNQWARAQSHSLTSYHAPAALQ